MQIDTSKITIREGRLSDIREIALMKKDIWLDTYPNEKLGISRQDIERRFENHEEWVKKNEQKFIEGKADPLWVAEYEGRIVGESSAAKKDGVSELSSVYVRTEYQNSGIGGLLIEKALNYLGKAKEIQLEVASYNENAIKFYEKYGFQKVGKEYPYEKPGQVTIPIVKMVKKF